MKQNIPTIYRRRREKGRGREKVLSGWVSYTIPPFGKVPEPSYLYCCSLSLFLALRGTLTFE